MMELANVIVEVIVIMPIGKDDPRDELITEGVLCPHHPLKHFFSKAPHLSQVLQLCF